MADVLILRPEGMYCPAGDFYVDPWRPVARAIITHAHADHARPGHAHYLASTPSEPVMAARLGAIRLQTLDYGVPLQIGQARVSLHPAGHVLGSAQVRIEVGGQVWVASGDYKLGADPTCTAFEPVRCHCFITESTFGLPVYRWPDSDQVYADIRRWWERNAAAGQASVIYAYAFGKAQRLLAGVLGGYGDRLSQAQGPGPVIVHGAVAAVNRGYREAGVALPPVSMLQDYGTDQAAALHRALVIAPPSVAGSPWLRRFGECADGFASGWMQLRGARRRRGVDRGFVLSDHADWPELMQAIDATGAGRVIVTHGSVPTLVRYLSERGLQAGAFETQFGMEEALDGHGDSGAVSEVEQSGQSSEQSSD